MDAMLIPHHSIEAEQACIGSVLLRNNLLDDLGLEPEMFFAHQNRLVWKTLLEMREDGEVMDALTVIERMRGDGSLDVAGGVDYLLAIANRVSSAANVMAYAKAVRDCATARSLVAAFQESLDAASAAAPADMDAVLEGAQQKVLALSLDKPSEVVGIAPVIAEFRERVRRRHAREDVRLPTGLVDLDQMLEGGMQGGDLIIVGGRPSMGKSGLAMQWGDHAAVKLKRSVLVFSMEMGRVQCMNRTVSRLGDIPLSEISSGAVHGRPYVDDVLDQIADARLEIDDRPALTLRQVRHKARNVKRKVGLDLVILDYLQLMAGDGDDRRQVIEEISRGLKAMAKELNIPVVVLSQLSRKCEERVDKRPMPSDLREAGGIEQDADVIIFVYRHEVYHPNLDDWKGVAELIVAKQRDGSTGVVNTRFFGSRTAFRNLGGPLPERKPGGGRSRGMPE